MGTQETEGIDPRLIWITKIGGNQPELGGIEAHLSMCGRDPEGEKTLAEAQQKMTSAKQDTDLVCEKCQRKVHVGCEYYWHEMLELCYCQSCSLGIEGAEFVVKRQAGIMCHGCGGEIAFGEVYYWEPDREAGYCINCIAFE